MQIYKSVGCTPTGELTYRLAAQLLVLGATDAKLEINI